MRTVGELGPEVILMDVIMPISQGFAAVAGVGHHCKPPASSVFLFDQDTLMLKLESLSTRDPT